MPAASEVPGIKEAHFFACADAERLKAMEEVQRARSDEERLVATLVVTNLYQKQIDDLSGMMPELEALAGAERDQAVAWANAWIEEAGKNFPQWGDYQEQLVGRVGRERATELAAGSPTDRLQRVIDTAKQQVIEEARIAGLDVDQLLSEGTGQSRERATKLCPDCAEEIKAEARKCRFCGYRFEEAEGSAPSDGE